MTALRAANPKAAAAIWRWREGEADDEKPSAASVRLRGSLHALVGYGAAALFYFFWSQTAAAISFAAANPSRPECTVTVKSWIAPRLVFEPFGRTVSSPSVT